MTRGEAVFAVITAALGSVALAAMLPSIVWAWAVLGAAMGGL